MDAGDVHMEVYVYTHTHTHTHTQYKTYSRSPGSLFSSSVTQLLLSPPHVHYL